MGDFSTPSQSALDLVFNKFFNPVIS